MIAATTTQLTVAFTTQPNALGALDATVTTDNVSSGAPVQVATVVLDTTLTEPAGTTAPTSIAIGTLLGTHYGDPDKNTKPGIAVLATTGNGTWQYFNGTKWSSIAPVLQTGSLLLPKADRLRFLPAGLASQNASLLYVAWDGSEGRAGTYVNTVASGGGGSFSTDAGMLNVSLTPVTQAPVWLASTTTLAPILPGTMNPVGQMVQQAFAGVFSADNGQAAGIAVTAMSGTSSGTWQYNLFDANLQTYSGWTSFPRVSATAALLLSDQDMIAFVPKTSSFVGTATLTVRAWDQSTGTDGGPVNLSKSTSSGGKTAYSARPLTATIHVNTAPTQNPPAGAITLPAINENVASAAVSVVTLLQDASATDVDKGTTLGLAITAASGPGTWQFKLAGGAWQTVPASLALLLPRSAFVRFVPTPNASGSATLTWVAWDQTQGTGGARGFVIPGSGGAFAFSTASATATLTITASHEAPAWSGTGAALTPVLPDTTQPAGDSVDGIFGAYFQDPGTPTGIAIAGLTATGSGTWQFFDGTNWTTIGTVSKSKALLLPASYLLRFVPKMGFLGTATLTAYAWDGSVGQAGSAFNINGKTGGTGPFSSTTLSATCLVNTAPTLTN